MFQKCPVFYIQGTSPYDNTCYGAAGSATYEREATARCHAIGGWLAYPRSTDEYNLILAVSKLAGVSETEFWLGGKKIKGM